MKSRNHVALALLNRGGATKRHSCEQRKHQQQEKQLKRELKQLFA
ncbi:hypothetical protein [Polynucleobacter sp. JS-Safj-400b-B2]|nr:hypothetical protein [Polynucleobacter sp. JS-Safj-400b-B2]